MQNAQRMPALSKLRCSVLVVALVTVVAMLGACSKSECEGFNTTTSECVIIGGPCGPCATVGATCGEINGPASAQFVCRADGWYCADVTNGGAGCGPYRDMSMPRDLSPAHDLSSID